MMPFNSGHKVMTPRHLLLLLACISITYSAGLAQNSGKYGSAALRKTTGVSWSKKIRQGFTMKLWMSNQMTMGQAAWLPVSPPKGIATAAPASEKSASNIPSVAERASNIFTGQAP